MRDILNTICCAKLVVKQGRKAMGLNAKIARLPNTIHVYDVLFCLFSICFNFKYYLFNPILLCQTYCEVRTESYGSSMGRSPGYQNEFTSFVQHEITQGYI